VNNMGLFRLHEALSLVGNRVLSKTNRRESGDRMVEQRFGAGRWRPWKATLLVLERQQSK
jgi:hypothetical protein